MDRPSSRRVRNSSSSWSKPIATNPPSRASNGGSATSAASNKASRVSWPIKSRAAPASSSGMSSGNASEIDAALSMALRTAAISRGPPRSSDNRDNARSKSGTSRNRSFNVVAISPRSKHHATASCRMLIRDKSRDGEDNRRSNNRAPPAVSVLSITPNRDPARPPFILRVSSNDFLVDASICIDPLRASRTGGRKRGSFPFWVISKYSTIAAIAAISARVNAPKPSSDETE